MSFLHKLQATVLDTVARKAAGFDDRRRKKTARLLAWLAHDVLNIRREHVVSALKKHLGISHARAVIMGKQVYVSFFENAIEMASIPYLTRDQILGRIEPTGLENLKNALARKKGTILISGHYGLWEMIPPWLVFNGFSITSVARNQSNKEVDAWMKFMRTSHGAKATDSGFTLREILRTLKTGDCLGLMSDQDAGDKGIFVEFLGEIASCPVGPAHISRKTGAPLIVLGLHRRPGKPHLLEISAPIFPESFPASEEGDRQITLAYNRVLETWIRRRPDQWFWLHRRWKTKKSEPRMDTNKHESTKCK